MGSASWRQRRGQGGGKGGHVGEAVPGQLRDRLHDRGGQGSGDVGPPAGQRCRLIQHLHREDVAPPRPDERRRATEQLIKDDPQRVDVGAVIDQPIDAAALLGRHVRGRPQQRSRQRVDGRPADRIGHLRDPEVDDLHAIATAVRDEEQIVGLEIAMDDPARVGRRQRLGRLHADVDDGGGVQGATAGGPLAEGLALQQLHRHVRHPLRQQPHVEHLHHARMVDRERRARLVEEARGDRRVAHQLGPKDLDRDPAFQQRMTGLVHDAHPAPAQDADQGVVVDLATDQAFPQVVGATGERRRRLCKRRSRQRGQHHLLTRPNPPNRWRARKKKEKNRRATRRSRRGPRRAARRPGF
jgi:hypothetical protein